MKKLILSCICAIAAVFYASAINPFVEFQPIQVGDGWTAFNVQAGVTAKVHPSIAVGGGIGITEKWNFNEAPLIPIFARGEYSTSFRGFKPFVSFDLGYEVNTNKGESNAIHKSGAVLVNPMIGLKFNSWYAGIGYLGHCWTAKGDSSTSTFNVKIGYNF
ncbi:MAG: hypothetical protein K2H86_06520 [Muribaculaceae bacterium]|nr:hypothetical protein [Muribaculaceae bacterium]